MRKLPRVPASAETSAKSLKCNFCACLGDRLSQETEERLRSPRTASERAGGGMPALRSGINFQDARLALHGDDALFQFLEKLASVGNSMHAQVGHRVVVRHHANRADTEESIDQRL